MSYKWIETNQLLRRLSDGAHIPCVVDNADYDAYLQWVAAGNVAQPADAPTLADYTGAIQAILDAKARELDYDNIHTAVTYRDDPDPEFSAEGQALYAWRSAVWVKAREILAAVTAGERAAPTLEALVLELPPAPVL